MSVEKGIYKSKRLKGIHISIIVLLVIILLTAGLSLYNSSLEKQNTDLKDELKQKNFIIKSKKENKLVQIYDLYTLNKSAISRLEKYSEVVSFMNNLEQLSEKYSVGFKGFDYSNGVLSVEATTVSEEEIYDYQKTSNFIKSYRKDENALFKLGFIQNVSTEEDREHFNITLELK